MRNLTLISFLLFLPFWGVAQEGTHDRRGISNEFDAYLPALLEQAAPPPSGDVNTDGLIDSADPIFEFLNPSGDEPGPPVAFRITPGSPEVLKGQDFTFYIDAIDRNGRVVNPGTPARSTDTLSFTSTISGSAFYPAGGKVRQLFITDAVGKAVTVRAGSTGSEYTLVASAVNLTTGTATATLNTGSSILGSTTLINLEAEENPAPAGTNVLVYAFDVEKNLYLEKKTLVTGANGAFFASGLNPGQKLVVIDPLRSGNRYYNLACQTVETMAGSFVNVEVAASAIETTSTLQGNAANATFGQLFVKSAGMCEEAELDRLFTAPISDESYSSVLPAGEFLITAEGFNNSTQSEVFNYGVETTLVSDVPSTFNFQLYELTLAENVCPDFTRTDITQSGFRWSIPETNLTGPVKVRLHSRTEEDIWVYEDSMDSPNSALTVQEVSGGTEFILEYSGPLLQDNQIYFWEMTARSPEGKPYSLGDSPKVIFHEPLSGNGCVEEMSVSNQLLPQNTSIEAPK